MQFDERVPACQYPCRCLGSALARNVLSNASPKTRRQRSHAAILRDRGARCWTSRSDA